MAGSIVALAGAVCTENNSHIFSAAHCPYPAPGYPSSFIFTPFFTIGSFGFTNGCGEPVALLFIQLNGEHRFDRVVKPGERFDIGVSEKIIKATSWLFTACPAEYVPNLSFTAENQTQISKSQYECVRK